MLRHVSAAAVSARQGRALLIRASVRGYAKKTKKSVVESHSELDRTIVLKYRYINNGGRTVTVNESAIAETLQRNIEHFQRELSQLRVGRASAAMLESVKVKVGEKDTLPLTRISTVMARDGQVLAVHPQDIKHVKALCAAIQSAGLNLTFQMEGAERILVTIPKVTQELRESMARLVASLAENSKTHVRAVRRDALQELKDAIKDRDELRLAEAFVSKMHDQSIQKVEQLVEAKRKELLS